MMNITCKSFNQYFDEFGLNNIRMDLSERVGDSTHIYGLYEINSDGSKILIKENAKATELFFDYERENNLDFNHYRPFKILETNFIENQMFDPLFDEFGEYRKTEFGEYLLFPSHDLGVLDENLNIVAKDSIENLFNSYKNYEFECCKSFNAILHDFCDGIYYSYPNEFKEDKNLAILNIEQDEFDVYDFNDKLISDKEVVDAFIRNKSYYIEYSDMIKLCEMLPDEIRSDKDLCLVLINNFPDFDDYIFNYFSEYFNDDKDVMLAAVKHDRGVLYCASDRLKDDRDVVIAAIYKDEFALQFASDRLKNDKDIVLTAVKQCGTVLHYASPELKDDIQVVLAAVKSSPNAIIHASDRIKKDLSLLKEPNYEKTSLSYRLKQAEAIRDSFDKKYSKTEKNKNDIER